MQVVSGTISLGVRMMKAGQYSDGRGIWFAFDGTENVTVRERDTGAEATVAAGVKTSDSVKVRFEEKLDQMLLSLNGETVIKAALENGHLTVYDKAGKELQS